MDMVKTADLCTHVDRLKELCDRLEFVQDDPRKYQVLIAKIRAETDAFRAIVCAQDPLRSVGTA
jgi:hypothetical protein